MSTIKVDTINEQSSGSGVTIDGVLMKDGEIDGVDVAALNTSQSSHVSNTSNPHEVTKAQVGLSNADNTSDENKPISAAQQAALDTKASASALSTHIADDDNPHNVNASDVGLGNVDNTSDADKPISAAQQAALNLKADQSNIDIDLKLRTELADVNDIFIYDTRKDSDGGAWRFDPTKSWYNEPLNTATRGSRREFPEVALLVATNGGLTIYDAKDGTMWMVFLLSGSSLMIGQLNSILPTCVAAIDGKIFVGQYRSGGFIGGLTAVDFVLDGAVGAVGATSSNSEVAHPLNIANRNTHVAFSDWNDAVVVIIDNHVNDVDVAIINGELFVAVATDSGVSIINWNQQTVVDVTGTVWDSSRAISLSSDGTLISAKISSVWTVGWLFNIEQYTNDVAGTWSGYVGHMTTPAKWPSNVVTDSLTRKNHLALLGHSAGLTLHKEAGVFGEAGVRYLTKDYISEMMYGDIQCSFPFYNSVDDVSAADNDLDTTGATVSYNTDAPYGNAINITVADGTATVDTRGANYSFGLWVEESDGWYHYIRTNDADYKDGEVISSGFTSRMTWATNTVTIVAGSEDVAQAFATNQTLTPQQVREMYLAGLESLQAETDDALGLGSGNYSKLQGSLNDVRDVAIADDGKIYVATGGASGGAITVLNKYGTAVVDYYDATRNNSDDNSAARASTDFQHIAVIDDTIAFATTAETWLQRANETLYQHYKSAKHLVAGNERNDLNRLLQSIGLIGGENGSLFHVCRSFESLENGDCVVLDTSYPDGRTVEKTTTTSRNAYGVVSGQRDGDYIVQVRGVHYAAKVDGSSTSVVAGDMLGAHSTSGKLAKNTTNNNVHIECLEAVTTDTTAKVHIR